MQEGKQCRIFYQEQDRILATEKDPGQVLEVAGVKLCVFNVEMAIEKINWLLLSVFSARKRVYSFFSFFYSQFWFCGSVFHSSGRLNPAT
jgi:hypothetical protein